MPEEFAAYSPVNDGGLQRTDMYCHDCSKSFIAEVDFDINGQHVLECPHCGHEHCRHIKDGKISNERWDTRNYPSKDVTKASTWKSNVLQIKTSTAAQFLRDKWLQIKEK